MGYRRDTMTDEITIENDDLTTTEWPSNIVEGQMMQWRFAGYFTSSDRATHHLDTHYPNHIPQRYNGGITKGGPHENHSRVVSHRWGGWVAEVFY